MLHDSVIWIVGDSKVRIDAARTFFDMARDGLGPASPPQERRLEVPSIDELVQGLSSGSVTELMSAVIILNLEPSVVCWPPNAEAIRNLEGIWKLLLLFPEVYWIVVVDRDAGGERISEPQNGPVDQRFQDFARDHSVRLGDKEKLNLLILCHGNGGRTIFDPTGVRRSLTGLRHRFKGLSVEDEWSFCLLNGYYLYRRRGAVSLAPTGQECRRQLNIITKTPGESGVVIEDVELNFADEPATVLEELAIRKTQNESWEELIIRRGRRWQLGLLEARVILTGLKLNEAEMRGKLTDREAARLRLCAKPYAGFFDALFPECEVLSLVSCASGAVTEVRLENTHSPPGVNQEVAALLLERVRMGDERRVEFDELIARAVMASTAEELLGGRPLHLAAEAAIQTHCLEVSAESSWVGLVASTPREVLEAGYSDLKWFVEHSTRRVTASQSQRPYYTLLPSRVARSFGSPSTTVGEQEAEASASALTRAHVMLHACSEIRRIYAENNRRAEENLFLEKYRDWLRREWEYRLARRCSVSRVSRPFRWVLGVGFRYLNFLMRGWHAVLISSLIWIVGCALAYQRLAASADISGGVAQHLGFGDWMLHSAAVFAGFVDKLDGGVGASNILDISFSFKIG